MKPISWKEAQKVTMDVMLSAERRREAGRAGDSMVEVPTGLWYKMIAQHETVKKPDFRNPANNIVGCVPCDGGQFRTLRPNDPDYECDIWKGARILGLLPVGND